MAVPLTQIPDVLLVPGQYQEIDNSLAGSTSEVKKALVVAYKTVGGTAPVGVPVLILSAQKAGEYLGFGSPAALACADFLAINRAVELWALPVAEPETGSAWSQDFTFAVTTAGNGSIDVSINGETVSALVASQATLEDITASVVAAVNGIENLPVEAEATGGVVTLSSKVKGEASNDIIAVIDINVSGVTVTEAGASNGTGETVVSTLFAGLGDERYNYFISNLFNAQNVLAWSDELTSRYSALRQIGGRLFVSVRGTLEEVLAKAETVNSPHIVMVGQSNSNQLLITWASRFCASATTILADDPAGNTYDTVVTGLRVWANDPFETRQKLLEYGVATWRMDPSGNVLIERLVTTYTENSDGERDTSYLDVQVTETVDAVRTEINSTAKARYKTWKLASTNESFGPGSKVMTPSVFKAFLADMYQNTFIQEKQWCQDFESYKNSIFVEVKTDSKTRLEYIHQPNLIGQFYIGAGLLQFK